MLIGGLFIAVFTGMLENANAYDDFVREVPGGFLKIVAVCALVPAIVFLSVRDGYSTTFRRVVFSLIALFVILIITFFALLFATYGTINTLTTIFVIAALFGGGGRVLLIIITG